MGQVTWNIVKLSLVPRCLTFPPITRRAVTFSINSAKDFPMSRNKYAVESYSNIFAVMSSVLAEKVQGSLLTFWLLHS
jgi:hypothetical protein